MSSQILNTKKTITVGFFILQNATLRVIELYYIFFDKFCDVTKFQGLEIDTESIHLAFADKVLYDCIRPAMKQEWKFFRSEDCIDDDILTNSTTIFSLLLGSLNVKSTT